MQNRGNIWWGKSFNIIAKGEILNSQYFVKTCENLVYWIFSKYTLGGWEGGEWHSAQRQSGESSNCRHNHNSFTSQVNIDQNDPEPVVASIHFLYLLRVINLSTRPRPQRRRPRGSPARGAMPLPVVSTIEWAKPNISTGRRAVERTNETFKSIQKDEYYDAN